MYDDYDGIIVNEQWLFKAGFEFSDYLLFEEDNDEEVLFKIYKLKRDNSLNWFEYCINPNELGNDFCLKIGRLEDAVALSGNINYVHELQNIYFALTGEELIFN